jgi:C1A family cysteine protease
MAEEIKLGLGWLRDYPDFRDYTPDSETISDRLKKFDQQPVKAMLQTVGVVQQLAAALTPTVDLRQWCSPVEDQKTIGSCTAHAGIGMVEYYERRAFGKHIDASRLFLYKVTRNLLSWTGDTGAYLRSTMGALTLFGAPPEMYWPYDIANYDQEPTSFCYAYGQAFQAISYYRLDPPNTPTATLLDRIKQHLAAGLPLMFGFTVFSSISQANTNGGKIPFPASGERTVGGHAVMAVGYNNQMKIRSNVPKATEYTGALLIRNSWGAGWGDHGYGWLPYDYVLRGLAVDWWSLLKLDWVDTGQFGL